MLTVYWSSVVQITVTYVVALLVHMMVNLSLESDSRKMSILQVKLDWTTHRKLLISLLVTVPYISGLASRALQALDGNELTESNARTSESDTTV